MKIFLVILLITAMIIPLSSQELSEEEKEVRRKWKAYATPGKSHAYLMGLTGKWNAEIKMWMKPGDEAIEQKQVMKAEMILGDRYYMYSIKGIIFMGRQFEGLNITGFDNKYKKFITVWMDNMGTGIYITRGHLDETGKIRTEIGRWDDIATGEKVKVKTVTTTLSLRRFKFEMFMSGASYGDNFRTMEIIYSRIRE